MEPLEAEIAEWRSFVARGAAMNGRDLEELEDHLRSQIADLGEAGLAEDEAFLVAVKRIGSLDELSREFAREHSGRLWRQLVTSDGGEREEAGTGWPEALGFAVAAAIAVLIVLLASGYPGEEPSWLARNIGLLVFPFLAAYFVRRRSLTLRQTIWGAIPFASTGVIINFYPYVQGSFTELLVAVHLPVLLWFVVAYPYMSGELGSHERRMDFVRFTGELFIY